MFGAGVSVLMNNVDCNGTEKGLHQCNITGSSIHSCDSKYSAGVFCSRSFGKFCSHLTLPVLCWSSQYDFDIPTQLYLANVLMKGVLHLRIKRGLRK